MWGTIASIALFVLKWAYEAKENRKLSDKEFIEQISKYQSDRAGAGDQATSFEGNMRDLRDELDSES